jgi:ubiquitin-associated SH3 domain-containing protein
MTDTELILYACPTGELAEQLERYFDLSRNQYGPNAAHRYMPHITLTGFFRDLPTTADHYVRQLDRALAAMPSPDPEPTVALTGLLFKENFHLIQVESPWLKQLTLAYIPLAGTESRREAIRPKDWLHLSLAYDFPAQQHAALQQLALTTVHTDAPAAWELRLYERHPDNSWTCHHAWSLP